MNMNIFDVAIIGSGFAGSVCGAVLAKLGWRVVMIERGEHPRFAIGESATPVSSKKIRYMGKKYGIPEFVNMATYDSIKEANIDVCCGPKELFHYFIHDEGVNSLQNVKIQEFIVQTPEVDPQYLRADSDKYMVDVAKKYGVEYLDKTEVTDLEFSETGVSIQCRQDGVDKTIPCKFLIDGTGFKSIVGNKYNLRSTEEEMDTPLKSRSIFTHFTGVKNLDSVLQNLESFEDHSPAPRVRGTQHHCFDGGWFWVIPFESGVTSVGLNLDAEKYPFTDADPEQEFWEFVRKYPVVEELMSEAENVRPYVKTPRMQFLNKQLVGDRWAMLPASAFGLDAWFSTGLAGSFICVDRLVSLLDKKVLKSDLYDRQELIQYEKAIHREYHYVSRMINGMYKSFKHFDVFKNYASICFMGAESFIVDGGIETDLDPGLLILNTGNDDFIEKFTWMYDKVLELNSNNEVDPEETEGLADYLRNQMKNYNFRQFGDPSMAGMHPRVMLPKTRNRKNETMAVLS